MPRGGMAAKSGPRASGRVKQNLGRATRVSNSSQARKHGVDFGSGTHHFHKQNFGRKDVVIFHHGSRNPSQAQQRKMVNNFNAAVRRGEIRTNTRGNVHIVSSKGISSYRKPVGSQPINARRNFHSAPRSSGGSYARKGFRVTSRPSSNSRPTQSNEPDLSEEEELELTNEDGESLEIPDYYWMKHSVSPINLFAPIMIVIMLILDIIYYSSKYEYNIGSLRPLIIEFDVAMAIPMCLMLLSILLNSFGLAAYYGLILTMLFSLFVNFPTRMFLGAAIAYSNKIDGIQTEYAVEMMIIGGVVPGLLLICLIVHRGLIKYEISHDKDYKEFKLSIVEYLASKMAMEEKEEEKKVEVTVENLIQPVLLQPIPETDEGNVKCITNEQIATENAPVCPVNPNPVSSDRSINANELHIDRPSPIERAEEDEEKKLNSSYKFSHHIVVDSPIPEEKEEIKYQASSRCASPLNQPGSNNEIECEEEARTPIRKGSF